MLSSLLYEVAAISTIFYWLLATSPLTIATKMPVSHPTVAMESAPSSSSADRPLFAPNSSYNSAMESNNSKNMNKQIEVVPANNAREPEKQPEAVNSAEDLYLDKHSVVATTPKMAISSKAPSRYEQGLEDYEEAVARVDKVKEEQQQQIVNGWTSLYAIFNFLHNAWAKSPEESRSLQARTNDNVNNSTEIAEARYIKGDPLKGYYDFIITEGSYKFWVVFQLFTALLMIYSTLAAIYYSKVNPVVGDYDYTAYLGGRSMADDPEPLFSSSTIGNLANSQWFQSASHSFQFVMDAIEKLPETR